MHHTVSTIEVSIYKIFSLCKRKWRIFTLIESLEQSHIQDFYVTRFFLGTKMRRNSDNRCNYFHFIFHSFSVHCHQKALDPLKVNWHYANWGWSNVDYLDNDSSRSHLLHCSTNHCNLPLQVDQLQPSSHVWDHIQKNWRGEKPKGNHWGTSFCWIPKVPSTNNWRLLKNSKWNPNKPSINPEKNNQKIKLKIQL